MREQTAPVNGWEYLNCVDKAEDYLLKLQWDIVQLTLKLDKWINKQTWI